MFNFSQVFDNQIVGSKKEYEAKIWGLKMSKNKKNGLPEYLYLGINSEARKIFDHIAAKYPKDVNVELDFGELAIFAKSAERLSRLNQKFSDVDLYYVTDKGNLVAHPVRDEMSMLERKISQAGAKLGLTPDARNKIKISQAEIAKSETKSGRKKNLKLMSVDEQIAEDVKEFV